MRARTTIAAVILAAATSLPVAAADIGATH